MTDFIERLTEAQPTLDDAESYDVFKTLLFNSRDIPWVTYSSEILGMEQTTALAQQYVDIFAAVDIEGQRMFMANPVHIYHASSTKDTFNVTGMLYSNGSVAYVWPTEGVDEKPILIVWIEKDLIDKLDLPYKEL